MKIENVRASQIQGTGIGLTGVKELVERFGGQIELSSQQDQGSTLYRAPTIVRRKRQGWIGVLLC